MKKIKQKLSRGGRITLLLLTCLFITGFSSANAYDQLQLGVILSGDDNIYEFTPSSDGTLLIETNNYNNHSLDYFMGLVYEDSSLSSFSRVPTQATEGAQGLDYTYQLSSSKIYYIYLESDFLNPWTYLCTFKSSGGSIDPGPDPEEPGDFPLMEVPSNNFVPTENIYIYTPTQNGTLTVNYPYAHGDNHLFYSTEFIKDNNVPYIEGGGAALEYKWILEAGTTYYFQSTYVKNNSLKTYFEPEGGSIEPDPVNIYDLLVPYTYPSLTPGIYKYTPNIDGLLVIEFNQPSGFNFLYSDLDLTQLVDFAEGSEYDSKQKWAVISNNTYYLDGQNIRGGIITSFEVQTDPDPGTDPEPGEYENYLPVNTGTPLVVNYNDQTKYYFIPEFDRTLFMTVSAGKSLNMQTSTFLYEENGNLVPLANYTSSDIYNSMIVSEASWNLQAGNVYYFQCGVDDGLNLYFTYPVIVNIGDFNGKPILWSKEGNDFEGIISYPESEEIDLHVSVEPEGDWANIEEPDSWENGGMHMPSWIWNLKESMKNNNQIIDGYYKEPVVSKPEQELDGSVNFNVFFGCSGKYRITVSTTNEDVVFKGEKEQQIINVYPNLRNSYSVKSNVEGEDTYESSLVINEMNINNHKDGNLQMNYVKDENGNLFTGKYDEKGNLIYAKEMSELSNSVIFVRGLFFTNENDGIYYKYDEIQTPKKARALAEDGDNLSDYNKVTSDGTMDLSGLKTNETTNPEITFRIVKNGVDTGDGVAQEADYKIGLYLTTEKPTAVEGIEAPEDGEAVYYNLQGVKVANPANGIYIKVQGGKATKVLVK